MYLLLVFGIKEDNFKPMLRTKKAQAGNIIGNFVLSLLISIIVFAILYGVTPVLVSTGAQTVSNTDADILTRLTVYFLPTFAWVIWLFGTVYMMKKAKDGEAIWE